MRKLYDKNGREIMLYDVLKVFHFTSARRKKHYMYKWVTGISDDGEYFEINHLQSGGAFYHQKIDGRLDDCEIVQGYGTEGMPFEDRPIECQENNQ